MIKKDNKNQTNNILSRITDIYITIIIILFPLMVDKTGFFKILECKYRYYVSITTVYILITTILFIYGIYKKKEKIKNSTSHRNFNKGIQIERRFRIN